MGPHPDDIEIGAGATVAALAAQGKSICFLICTDGRYGTNNLKDNISPEELIAIRRDEAIHSAAALGVNDVRFFDFYSYLFALVRIMGEDHKHFFGQKNRL